MSYVDQANKADPAGIAAALAVNGAIAAALIFMTVHEGVRTFHPPTKTFDVPPKSAPPIEPKQIEKQLPTTPPVFVPDTIVPTIDPPTKTVTTTNEQPSGPPLQTGGNIGEGTKIAIAELPKITPPILPPPAPIFESAVRDPKFASRFQPNYPPGMLQREIEGTVTIRVLIGTDGRVRAANVIKAATPEFAAASERQALSQWRFKPATRDGQAVEDWQTLTVRFDINS